MFDMSEVNLMTCNAATYSVSRFRKFLSPLPNYNAKKSKIIDAQQFVLKIFKNQPCFYKRSQYFRKYVFFIFFKWALPVGLIPKLRFEVRTNTFQ